MEDIPDNINENNSEKLVPQLLKSIIKKNNIRETNAVASLLDAEVIVRSIELPLMPEEELKNMIRLQAERFIFTDLNEMDIDYNITSRDDKRMELLFIAAPAGILNKKVQEIQGAGLNPVIMDIHNLALANCFFSLGPEGSSGNNENIILVDIGHTKTYFTILKNRNFCFTKSIEYGGDNISKLIANELNMSLNDAEMLKKNPSKWNSSGLNMKSILRKSLPDLLEAVYKSVEYCKSQQSICSVDRIFLTGGSSYIEDIEDLFVEILGVKTEVWNPLSNIKTNIDQQKGQFMAVVLGLALRKYANV